eukprot:scaffold68028_cov27-Tisochrysis_lutea.AAC.4
MKPTLLDYVSGLGLGPSSADGSPSEPPPGLVSFSAAVATDAHFPPSPFPPHPFYADGVDPKTPNSTNPKTPRSQRQDSAAIRESDKRKRPFGDGRAASNQPRRRARG